MSFNRNLSEDRAATRAVLNGQPRTTDGQTNWLGHRLDAATAALDEMLLVGATRAEMAATRGAIDEHLRHLRVEHGLPLVEVNGVWRFDQTALPDPWQRTWQELRDNLLQRPRCALHPEYPFVETLGRQVVNDIVSIDDTGLSVRSHESDNQDFIGADRFEKWWVHLVRVGSASLRTGDANNPDPWRSSVVGAILVAGLAGRICRDQVDPVTIRIFNPPQQPKARVKRPSSTANGDSMPAGKRGAKPDPPIPPAVAPPAPDKVERLKTVKLVLEIAVAVMTLIVGIVALIWGTR